MKHFSLLAQQAGEQNLLDRQDAGKRLAKVLRHFSGPEVVILALPRGGVVLGAEVSRELEAPLGLVLVRKIGHPSAPEYAIGAIAENDDPIYNTSEVIGISVGWLKQAEASAKEMIERRRKIYYGEGFTLPKLKSKTVIIVDDGIATGLTMQAAVHAAKRQQPKRVIVAVPVAPQESIDKLEEIADEVIVLDNPANFLGSVGNHYVEFDQVDDEEVKTLLWEVYDDLRQSVTKNR